MRRDAQAALVARGRGTLTVREWVKSLRGPKAHAIWSPTDPMPFVVDLIQATLTGIGMLSTRVRSAGGRRRAVPNVDRLSTS
jgi:predicted ATP-grasp superfamily ATP-dependent carboligase